MSRPVSLAELLAQAQVRLAACGIEQPRLEAEVLLAHALGIDRGRLALLLAGREAAGGAAGGRAVDPEDAARFRAAARRRALREPLAYITGVREFWSMELEVTPAVLIPRPETEILVQEALAVLGASEPTLVLDVGTGSGAVALAVASERPAVLVVASDLSAAALEVAGRNRRRQGLEARVDLVRADLLTAVQPGARRRTGSPPRLVLSNPPYVGLEERETLMPEVRLHEPESALFAGRNGLEVIERLAPQAASVLGAGEWLMMEVAAPRAAEVVALLTASGSWDDVGVRDDYSGLPRVVKARRSTAKEPGGHG